MATVNRYLRHPASTVTGSGAVFDENHPLGAGRHQLLLASNTRYLLRQNTTRQVATHPGVRLFWRASARGISATFSGSPGPDEIQWDQRAPSAVSLCLGTHHTKRFPGDARFPQLVARFRTVLEDPGDTMGVVLLVVPGLRGHPTSTAHHTSSTYTGTAYASRTLTLPLSEGDLARVGMEPVSGTSTDASDEPGEVLAFVAFLGAYCSSNQNAVGRRASIVGITLGLEAPA
jgi:hypothetical protein